MSNLTPGWAIYLRVSDEDKQTPERSFAMQRDKISEQLLSSSEVQFGREYFDMLTGTSPNRADYQLMLADAVAGKFSHLGLYRADRFGRNAVEGLQAATKLISLGVKIRVANMPTLTPEEPDGFFMFLLQMGLAQREVDVLRLRTADGMKAKMRAGGWPYKAPEGYLNKEKLVSSNKYDRWVEQDPVTIQMFKDAWDLLLSDRYTMAQICEELQARGYTRADGRPWVSFDAKNNVREQARSRLHQIFHNPFYAGWVVSKRFGIKFGEIRGTWEPIISTEQFEKGIEILRKNDLNKCREKKQFYLLRNLLEIEVDGRTYKMFGSSPKPRDTMYSYYLTHAKPDGKKIHVSCDIVDDQIPEWLECISVDVSLLNRIQEIYQKEIRNFVSDDREVKLSELKRTIAQLKDEETRLGRLFITGKITDSAYEELRSEWREKRQATERNTQDLVRKTSLHFNDLETALALLSKVKAIYNQLEDKDRSNLLRIIVKKVIIDLNGKIVKIELQPPFGYLKRLADELCPSKPNLCSSGFVPVGVLNENHPGLF